MNEDQANGVIEGLASNQQQIDSLELAGQLLTSAFTRLIDNRDNWPADQVTECEIALAHAMAAFTHAGELRQQRLLVEGTIQTPKRSGLVLPTR